ncbi:MAG: YtxH domain-containing protein [Thermomicrobiales bacterium]|nr:YtxH domain-containing protein [Thermomicrobiales bacterium]
MAKQRHNAAFVVGAILGGAVGAVLGLLKAPRPGAETRFDLSERWHDVEELAAEELVNIETEVRDRLASEWTPGAARV